MPRDLEERSGANICRILTFDMKIASLRF